MGRVETPEDFDRWINSRLLEAQVQEEDARKAQEVERIKARIFELERTVAEYEKNRRMQELASPPPVRQTLEQIDYEYLFREIMKHANKKEEPEKFKLPKNLFEIE
jgi:hypothetical protein